MKPDKQLVQVISQTQQAYKNSGQGEWSDWCAKHLLSSTDFNSLTQRTWEREELAEALSALKTTYDRSTPKHHLPHFLALRLSH